MLANAASTSGSPIWLAILAGLAGVFTGVGAFWLGMRRDRRDVREAVEREEESDRQATIDLGSVVNDKINMLFSGYEKIFNEYEARARQLLSDLLSITQERDSLIERVRELEVKVANLKAERIADRRRIGELEAEVGRLREAGR